MTKQKEVLHPAMNAEYKQKSRRDEKQLNSKAQRRGKGLNVESRI